MRFKEWIAILAISGVGMILANFIGFKIPLQDSIPGVFALLLISVIAVVLARILPFKLPTVAYCSLVGLLLACPASPIAPWIIDSAAKINFTAPLTMVGAFAGISISDQLKVFAKQGWKMVLITIFVMTGTFFGSLSIAQVVLKATKVI